MLLRCRLDEDFCLHFHLNIFILLTIFSRHVRSDNDERPVGRCACGPVSCVVLFVGFLTLRFPLSIAQNDMLSLPNPELWSCQFGSFGLVCTRTNLEVSCAVNSMTDDSNVFKLTVVVITGRNDCEDDAVQLDLVSSN